MALTTFWKVLYQIQANESNLLIFKNSQPINDRDNKNIEIKC